MKRKIAFFGLVSALAFTACNNDEIPENGGSSTGGSAAVIPADFHWSTDAKASVALLSPVSTVVSLYADAACTDENLLVGNLPLAAGEARTIDVTVPCGNEVLFVQYPVAGNAKNTAAVSLAAGNTRPTPLPEDLVACTSEENDGWTYYHNSGVVLFEDGWPNKGDYDFNDLVVEYDLKVTECNKPELLPAHGYKENLQITLDIRAMGGGLPKSIGVVLHNLDPRYVKEIETHIFEKSGQGVQTELNDPQYNVTVDTRSGEVTVVFTGFHKLVESDYTNFFQVTKGHIEIGKPMLRAQINLRGANRSTLDEIEGVKQLNAYRTLITETSQQNFFLGTTKGREIHLKGYRPTAEYADAYQQTLQENLWKASDFYCNTESIIWGMKVPVGLRHPYEKGNIWNAYPKLKQWVESNGTDAKDWYKSPVESQVVVRYW